MIFVIVFNKFFFVICNKVAVMRNNILPQFLTKARYVFIGLRNAVERWIIMIDMKGAWDSG